MGKQTAEFWRSATFGVYHTPRRVSNRLDTVCLVCYPQSIMRPRLITVPKVLLALLACAVVGGMVWWLRAGQPLPGTGIPSTANKIAFISDRNGHSDLFFMDADGKAAPVALTNDAASDTEPSWSASGSEIAFISADRKGVSPQVFVMDAREGAKVLSVTNTSPTKEQPQFGAGGRIYYLDAGKLNAGNADASDFDALFPGPDLRLALTGLFSTGGIERVAISSDGSRILAVLKGEDAQVLLLYEREGERLAVLGAANKVYPAFRPDGGWAAVFAGGGPLPEPGLLLSDEMMQQPGFVPPGPIPLKGDDDLNLLVVWDKSGAITAPARLPAPPNAMSISPDGKKVALCFSDPDDSKSALLAGLVIGPLDGGGAVTPIYKPPTSQPSWSPDSSHLVFVSGSDIYTVPADGSQTAVNLTQGKGSNSSPAWSPAAVKAPEAAAKK